MNRQMRERWSFMYSYVSFLPTKSFYELTGWLSQSEKSRKCPNCITKRRLQWQKIEPDSSATTGTSHMETRLRQANYCGHRLLFTWRSRHPKFLCTRREVEVIHRSPPFPETFSTAWGPETAKTPLLWRPCVENRTRPTASCPRTVARL